MSSEHQYLLAVYIESEAGAAPVPSGAVADRLDKSVPTATEMLQRLGNQGLVTYERYEGATVTDAGRTRAAALHETYVTVSWFFRGVLDRETHEAEAMELAAVIDPDVANRLTTVLPVDELRGSDG